MMLLARRNSGLETILQTFVDEELNKKQLDEAEDAGSDEEEPAERRASCKRKHAQAQPANRPGQRQKSNRISKW